MRRSGVWRSKIPLVSKARSSALLSFSSGKLTKQCTRIADVSCIESFGEPIIYWSEQLACLVAALLALRWKVRLFIARLSGWRHGLKFDLFTAACHSAWSTIMTKIRVTDEECADCFEKLWRGAFERRPFDVLCALLRVSGLQDADWDPFAHKSAALRRLFG